ncbi:hypothetical protein [uncultured Pseudoteredinibacter sp.]|uniref:hypothetical protein n=1 Tax=uncultured Pseudoteredinibacter sp. TaxID=1641701 RepID=UPI00262F265C|nr:hypothetical protein [uncultured Pseudoteredinibacter sp.]
MEWILNDLSLSHQFDNVDDFVEKMSVFLKAKTSDSLLNKNVLCPRQLGSVEVFEGLTFSHVVLNLVSRNLRAQILSWVNKNGPFWSDNRVDNPDDYFEYGSLDVTDQGLGECARREIAELDVTSFSFDGDYSKSPLVIRHGLEEASLGHYDIENIWGIDSLVVAAKESLPKPRNWDEAIDRVKEQCPHIKLSGLVNEQMSPVPFSIGNFESICERFRILREYLDSRDASGNHTEATNVILRNFFQGDKAWFSGSSADECRTFSEKLSFIDLYDGEKKLFPFHGKIKTPQLRIHFEWPVPADRSEIQVVYIGPKITKR